MSVHELALCSRCGPYMAPSDVLHGLEGQSLHVGTGLLVVAVAEIGTGGGPVRSPALLEVRDPRYRHSHRQKPGLGHHLAGLDSHGVQVVQVL